MTIIKIQSNIPITGTPTSAERVTGEYGPQVKLRGTFNGDGGAIVYINETCEGQLKTLGVIADGPDGKVTISRPCPITILRTEADGKKRTNVTLANGAAPAATNGHINGTGGHAPASAPQQSGESPSVTFARLKLTLTACLKAARDSWAAVLPAGEIPPPDLVTATAHTLFIAADRRNCLAPAPKQLDRPATDAQKAEIDAVSEQLASRHMWTRERLASEVTTAAKATDILKLTEAQAKLALAHLAARLQAMDAEAAAVAQAAAESASRMAAMGEDIPF